MSANAPAREPVTNKQGEVLYHLLPQAQLKDNTEGPLSIEEIHKRSQEVALGQRQLRETEAEQAERLEREAKEAADLAAWAAEKQRRKAAAEAQDKAEMQAFLTARDQAAAAAAQPL